MPRIDPTEHYVEKLLQASCISPGPLATAVAKLLLRNPDHLQKPHQPKWSNLQSVFGLVEDPENLSARAIEVNSAKHSEHRIVAQNHVRSEGKILAENVNIFSILSEKLATSKILREIEMDEDKFTIRLMLMTQIIPFLKEGEMRSISAKEFNNAIAMMIDIIVDRDVKVCVLSPSNGKVKRDGVRLLLTYGDHVEHGQSQENCVGRRKPLLCEVARGDKRLYEVIFDGTAYTVEVLKKDGRLSLGNVEAGGGEEIQHSRRQILSQMKYGDYSVICESGVLSRAKKS